MQDDDASTSCDDAAAWLRERYKNDPKPVIDISWREGEPVSRANYERILEILFSPRADSPSA